MQLTSPLQITPEYREYMWGGQRLRPGQLTAEMWAVHEDNLVTRRHAGRQNPFRRDCRKPGGSAGRNSVRANRTPLSTPRQDPRLRRLAVITGAP